MTNTFKSKVIQNTIHFVRDKLEGEGSGHDWWHIHRVRNMALTIADQTTKEIDFFIIELAALLHDIADHKFHDGDEEIGPNTAISWLNSQSVSQNTVKQVSQIIRELSFKGSNVETPMSTLEGEIVQDADRLDAIGAIGIARAFAFGGFKSREMYKPEQAPIMHSSFEDYKKDDGHTINHFYEKLFLLKDRMNTPVAKRIATERHQFMETFVGRFLEEWDGNL